MGNGLDKSNNLTEVLHQWLLDPARGFTDEQIDGAKPVSMDRPTQEIQGKKDGRAEDSEIQNFFFNHIHLYLDWVKTSKKDPLAEQFGIKLDWIIVDDKSNGAYHVTPQFLADARKKLLGVEGKGGDFQSVAATLQLNPKNRESALQFIRTVYQTSEFALLPSEEQNKVIDDYIKTFGNNNLDAHNMGRLFKEETARLRNGITLERIIVHHIVLEGFKKERLSQKLFRESRELSVQAEQMYMDLDTADRYMKEAAEKKKQAEELHKEALKEGVPYFEMALSFNRFHPVPHRMLAAYYLEKEGLRSPKFHEHLDAALKNDGTDAGILEIVSLLAKDPKIEDPWLAVAKDLAKQKRFAEAGMVYRKAAKTNPKSASHYLKLATKSEELDPDHFYYHQKLGELYMKQKNPTKAAEAYQRAMQLDLENDLLAQRYSEANYAAEKKLKRPFAFTPLEKVEAKIEGQIKKIGELIEKGKTKEAKQLLAQTLKDYDDMTFYGNSLLERGEGYEKKVFQFNETLVNYGFQLHFEGKPLSQLLNDVDAKAGEVEALVEGGDLAGAESFLADAEQTLQTIQSYSSHFPQWTSEQKAQNMRVEETLRFYRAQINQYRLYNDDIQSQYTRVVTGLTSAIEKNPADHHSYLLRARAHRQLGNYRESLADFRNAMDRAPDETEKGKIQLEKEIFQETLQQLAKGSEEQRKEHLKQVEAKEVERDDYFLLDLLAGEKKIAEAFRDELGQVRGPAPFNPDLGVVRQEANAEWLKWQQRVDELNVEINTIANGSGIKIAETQIQPLIDAGYIKPEDLAKDPDLQKYVELVPVPTVTTIAMGPFPEEVPTMADVNLFPLMDADQAPLYQLKYKDAFNDPQLTYFDRLDILKMVATKGLIAQAKETRDKEIALGDSVCYKEVITSANFSKIYKRLEDQPLGEKRKHYLQAIYHEWKIALLENRVEDAQILMRDFKKYVSQEFADKTPDAEKAFFAKNPELEVMYLETRARLRQFAIEAIKNLKDQDAMITATRKGEPGIFNTRLETEFFPKFCDTLLKYFENGKADTYEEALALMEIDHEQMIQSFLKKPIEKGKFVNVAEFDRNIRFGDPGFDERAKIANDFIGKWLKDKNHSDPRIRTVYLEGGAATTLGYQVNQNVGLPVKVVIGRKGGYVRVGLFSNSFYFPPLKDGEPDRERIVLIYNSITGHGIRFDHVEYGEDYKETRGKWGGPSNAGVDGARGVSYYNPDTVAYHQAFGLPNLWAKTQTKDPCFKVFFELNTREGLEAMRTEAGKRAYHLKIGQTLRGEGSINYAGQVFMEIYDKQLKEAIKLIPEEEKTKIEGEVKAKGAEIEEKKRKEYEEWKEKNQEAFNQLTPHGPPTHQEWEALIAEAVKQGIKDQIREKLAKKAFRTLDSWYEAEKPRQAKIRERNKKIEERNKKIEELKKQGLPIDESQLPLIPPIPPPATPFSDGDITEYFDAWGEFEGMEDPLDKAGNMSDRTKNEIKDFLFITAVTLPFTMGVGSLVKGLVSGTRLVIGLRAVGGWRLWAARAIVFVPTAIAGGTTQTAVMTPFGGKFNLKTWGFNCLMFGGFEMGMGVWGKFAKMAGIGDDAIAAAVRRGQPVRAYGLKAANFVGTLQAQTFLSMGFDKAHELATGEKSGRGYFGHLGQNLGYWAGGKIFHATTGNYFAQIEANGVLKGRAARKKYLELMSPKKTSPLPDGKAPPKIDAAKAKRLALEHADKLPRFASAAEAGAFAHKEHLRSEMPEAQKFLESRGIDPLSPQGKLWSQLLLNYTARGNKISDLKGDMARVNPRTPNEFIAKVLRVDPQSKAGKGVRALLARTIVSSLGTRAEAKAFAKEFPEFARWANQMKRPVRGLLEKAGVGEGIKGYEGMEHALIGALIRHGYSPEDVVNLSKHAEKLPKLVEEILGPANQLGEHGEVLSQRLSGELLVWALSHIEDPKELGTALANVDKVGKQLHAQLKKNADVLLKGAPASFELRASLMYRLLWKALGSSQTAQEAVDQLKNFHDQAPQLLEMLNRRIDRVFEDKILEGEPGKKGSDTVLGKQFLVELLFETLLASKDLGDSRTRLERVLQQANQYANDFKVKVANHRKRFEAQVRVRKEQGIKFARKFFKLSHEQAKDPQEVKKAYKNWRRERHSDLGAKDVDLNLMRDAEILYGLLMQFECKVDLTKVQAESSIVGHVEQYLRGDVKLSSLKISAKHPPQKTVRSPKLLPAHEAQTTTVQGENTTGESTNPGHRGAKRKGPNSSQPNASEQKRAAGEPALRNAEEGTGSFQQEFSNTELGRKVTAVKDRFSYNAGSDPVYWSNSRRQMETFATLPKGKDPKVAQSLEKSAIVTQAKLAKKALFEEIPALQEQLAKVEPDSRKAKSVRKKIEWQLQQLGKWETMAERAAAIAEIALPGFTQLQQTIELPLIAYVNDGSGSVNKMSSVRDRIVAVDVDHPAHSEVEANFGNDGVVYAGGMTLVVKSPTDIHEVVKAVRETSNEDRIPAQQRAVKQAAGSALHEILENLRSGALARLEKTLPPAAGQMSFQLARDDIKSIMFRIVGDGLEGSGVSVNSKYIEENATKVYEALKKEEAGDKNIEVVREAFRNASRDAVAHSIDDYLKEHEDKITSRFEAAAKEKLENLSTPVDDKTIDELITSLVTSALSDTNIKSDPSAIQRHIPQGHPARRIREIGTGTDGKEVIVVYEMQGPGKTRIKLEVKVRAQSPRDKLLIPEENKNSQTSPSDVVIQAQRASGTEGLASLDLHWITVEDSSGKVLRMGQSPELPGIRFEDNPGVYKKSDRDELNVRAIKGEHSIKINDEPETKLVERTTPQNKEPKLEENPVPLEEGDRVILDGVPFVVKNGRLLRSAARAVIGDKAVDALRAALPAGTKVTEVGVKLSTVWEEGRVAEAIQAQLPADAVGDPKALVILHLQVGPKDGRSKNYLLCDTVENLSGDNLTYLLRDKVRASKFHLSYWVKPEGKGTPSIHLDYIGLHKDMRSKGLGKAAFAGLINHLYQTYPGAKITAQAQNLAVTNFFTQNLEAVHGIFIDNMSQHPIDYPISNELIDYLAHSSVGVLTPLQARKLKGLKIPQEMVEKHNRLLMYLRVNHQKAVKAKQTQTSTELEFLTEGLKKHPDYESKIKNSSPISDLWIEGRIPDSIALSDADLIFPEPPPPPPEPASVIRERGIQARKLAMDLGLDKNLNIQGKESFLDAVAFYAEQNSFDAKEVRTAYRILRPAMALGGNSLEKYPLRRAIFLEIVREKLNVETARDLEKVVLARKFRLTVTWDNQALPGQPILKVKTVQNKDVLELSDADFEILAPQSPEAIKLQENHQAFIQQRARAAMELAESSGLPPNSARLRNLKLALAKMLVVDVKEAQQADPDSRKLFVNKWMIRVQKLAEKFGLEKNQDFTGALAQFVIGNIHGAETLNYVPISPNSPEMSSTTVLTAAEARKTKYGPALRKTLRILRGMPMDSDLWDYLKREGFGEAHIDVEIIPFSRIKSEEAIAQKKTRQGLKKDPEDIAGATIVVKELRDIPVVLAALKTKFKIRELRDEEGNLALEISHYEVNARGELEAVLDTVPDIDHLDRGIKGGKAGYRGVHVGVEVDGAPVEIRVLTTGQKLFDDKSRYYYEIKTGKIKILDEAGQEIGIKPKDIEILNQDFKDRSDYIALIEQNKSLGAKPPFPALPDYLPAEVRTRLENDLRDLDAYIDRIAPSANASQTSTSAPISSSTPIAPGIMEQGALMAAGVDPVAFAAAKKEYEASQASPQRKDLHQNIVNQLLAKGTSSDTPTIILMAGPMGAGKSTAIQGMQAVGILDLGARLLIDPDQIKDMIPEYQQLIALDYTQATDVIHPESMDITRDALDQALKQKKNIVLDGTLRNTEKVVQMVQNIRAEHPEYNVSIIYVDSEEKNLLERVAARAKATGRYIPDNRVIESRYAVKKSIEKLKSIVDVTIEIDNNSRPVIKSYYKDGRTTTVQLPLPLPREPKSNIVDLKAAAAAKELKRSLESKDRPTQRPKEVARAANEGDRLGARPGVSDENPQVPADQIKAPEGKLLIGKFGKPLEEVGISVDEAWAMMEKLFIDAENLNWAEVQKLLVKAETDPAAVRILSVVKIVTGKTIADHGLKNLNGDAHIERAYQADKSAFHALVLLLKIGNPQVHQKLMAFDIDQVMGHATERHVVDFIYELAVAGHPKAPGVLEGLARKRSAWATSAWENFQAHRLLKLATKDIEAFKKSKQEAMYGNSIAVDGLFDLLHAEIQQGKLSEQGFEALEALWMAARGGIPTWGFVLSHPHPMARGNFAFAFPLKEWRALIAAGQSHPELFGLLGEIAVVIHETNLEDGAVGAPNHIVTALAEVAPTNEKAAAALWELAKQDIPGAKEAVIEVQKKLEARQTGSDKPKGPGGWNDPGLLSFTAAAAVFGEQILGPAGNFLFTGMVFGTVLGISILGLKKLASAFGFGASTAPAVVSEPVPAPPPPVKPSKVDKKPSVHSLPTKKIKAVPPESSAPTTPVAKVLPTEKGNYFWIRPISGDETRAASSAQVVKVEPVVYQDISNPQGQVKVTFHRGNGSAAIQDLVFVMGQEEARALSIEWEVLSKGDLEDRFPLKTKPHFTLSSYSKSLGKVPAGRGRAILGRQTAKGRKPTIAVNDRIVAAEHVAISRVTGGFMIHPLVKADGTLQEVWILKGNIWEPVVKGENDFIKVDPDNPTSQRLALTSSMSDESGPFAVPSEKQLDLNDAVVLSLTHEGEVKTHTPLQAKQPVAEAPPSPKAKDLEGAIDLSHLPLEVDSIEIVIINPASQQKVLPTEDPHVTQVIIHDKHAQKDPQKIILKRSQLKPGFKIRLGLADFHVSLTPQGSLFLVPDAKLGEDWKVAAIYTPKADVEVQRAASEDTRLGARPGKDIP